MAPKKIPIITVGSVKFTTKWPLTNKSDNFGFLAISSPKAVNRASAVRAAEPIAKPFAMAAVVLFLTGILKLANW